MKHDSKREWVIESVGLAPEIRARHDAEILDLDWTKPNKIREWYNKQDAEEANPGNLVWSPLALYKWPKSIVECLNLYRTNLHIREGYVAGIYRNFGLRMRNTETGEIIPLQEFLGESIDTDAPF